MKIENYIFDFGGVLYDINPDKTVDAMSKYTNIKDLHSHVPRMYEEYIIPYEKGELTTEEFRNQIRAEFLIKADNECFDKAWNVTLSGIIKGVSGIVREMKNHGRVILLSNTNELHYEHFYPECIELFSLFERLFFSFQLGMAKPDPEIFTYVLEEMKLLPEKTLFIQEIH